MQRICVWKSEGVKAWVCAMEEKKEREWNKRVRNKRAEEMKIKEKEKERGRERERERERERRGKRSKDNRQEREETRYAHTILSTIIRGK